jgi:hypothetical protein
MAMADDFRRQELREIRQEYKSFYQLMGGLVLVLIGIWLGANIFADDAGYGTNLYTELISVAVTVFVLDTWHRHGKIHQSRPSRICGLVQEMARGTASGGGMIWTEIV